MFWGGSGNDLLDGGAEADFLAGGVGDDVYIVDDAGDQVVEAAGEGNDTVRTALGSHTLAANVEGLAYTGVGDFAGTGNALANAIVGGVGNDTLDGGAGADVLTGGVGDDVYVIDDVGDQIVENAGQGTDTVRTTLASYTLGTNLENLVHSGSGAFSGFGNAVANELTGGTGNDLLTGYAGDDRLDGGAGSDTADYAAAPGGVIANLATGLASDGNGFTDTLVRIENLGGSAFGDTLSGDAGDNALSGRGGNDMLVGGAGSDSLDGGAGIDTVDYATSTAGVVASLATGTADDGMGGTDTILGVENLIGSGFGDRLVGDAANNVLTGGAGDDVLAGGAGNNVLTGGIGSDTADYSATTGTLFVNLPTGGATSNGAGGADTLSGIENVIAGSGAATVIGDAGDNVITGGTASDYLIGGAGNDTLAGGTGAANALQGGSGDDIYIVSVAQDSVLEYAGEGTDTVRTALSSYTLRANLERLVYTGTGSFTGTGNAADNELTGGSGNDTLDGGLGNDAMTGGLGDDVYIVDALGDQIVELAGGGTDTIRTALSSYTLGSEVERLVFTGTGSFVGTGNALANAITGGTGADTLDGGAGADVLTGGAGNDLYLIDDAGDVIVELAGGGIDTARVSAASYTLGTEVEALLFSGTGSFSGTGNASANTLTGGAGDDSLSGAGGDDLLVGLGGNNSFDGGIGIDTVSYAGATFAVTASLASGLVSANGYGGSDTLTGVEKLIGSAFGDQLAGGTNDDSLDGGAGDDVLAGGAGNNVLTGGIGSDTADYSATTGTLFVNLPTGGATSNGAGGADTLSGIENVIAGSGAATVIGDAGDNVITGGTASDYLIGGAGNDTLAGGTGAANALQGGSGDDIYIVSVAQDSVLEYAGEGTDTVRTALSSYTLRANLERLVYTGTGSFTGTGNAADNELTGGSGNDTLDGGLGNDAMTGGLGDDVYIVDALGDQIVELAGGGTDTIRTALSSYTLGSEVERLVFTGTGSFVGTGNALANAITGGTGADTLDGGAGADVLTGGAGNDLYLIDDAGDVIVELAGGGIDTARVSAASYTLGTEVEALLFSGTGSFSGTGNASANTLTGGAGDDSLSGAGGDDLLVGLGGNNSFDGGIGIDTVSYAGATFAVTASLASGLVSANGYGGSDTLTGVEKLIGSAFGDQLAGGTNDDSLDGGAGDDVLAGGAGNNVLTGGIGSDTADYSATTGTLFVNLPTGGATSNGAGGADTLSGIENVIAGSGAATVIGDAGDNVITGGTASDYLIGGAGNDTLAGGTGAANALQGGSGDDIYIVSVAQDSVLEYAGEGTDTVRTALSSYTLRANLERLVYTGTGSFTGTGNAADNELTGGSGNDTLDGGLGNDTVIMRGLRTTYEIVTEGGLLKIRDLAPSVDGDDGTDTLIGIERVRFGDGETITLGAPIALDLDGGGVQLLAAGVSGAHDVNGNASSWIGGGDGFLFLDRDRDGGYSGIGEMSFIGDRPGATSDLDGLRAFDTTSDSILDAHDDAFASFMVWRDANGNGVADAGETGSLVQFGIQSISLVGTAVNAVSKIGETAVVNTGSFTRTDGTTGGFADVVLTSGAATQSSLLESLVSYAAQQMISVRPMAPFERLQPHETALIVS